MVFYMFNELRWKVIVCFVVTGVIVDHQCLDFIIIIDSVYILYGCSNCCLLRTSTSYLITASRWFYVGIPVISMHLVGLHQILWYVGICCFSLSKQHLKVIANTGWLGIRILCSSWPTCIPVDFCSTIKIKIQLSVLV